MDLAEILEILRQEHPDVGMSQMIRMLNRASDDFCTKTKIIESSFTLPGGLVADQRYYDLTDDIIEIKRIDIADEETPQLIGMPKKRDFT
tara:strand:+ start:121 stop:390 length:270 start_codon:yes stop_codon:yes gene_type:complete